MTKLQHHIDRFKQSKDGKTLASNMVYLTLLQIAGYLFPLITMPYLARVIGTVGFGKIAFASAIIAWIQTIADWGFNYTATRDVAKNRDDADKVSRIFSSVLWARCILALASLAVLVILIGVIPSFRENALIILFTFFLIPGHILYPDWFFQAVENMKYITILGVLIKFIFTLLVFLIIREADDYIYQPLIVSFGYMCSGVIALYFILIRWKVRVIRVPLRDIFATIKNSTNVFINNLMPNLYNSFSVILLGMFGTATHTGLFDAGRKLTVLSNMAMSVISRVFFPFLSRRIDKHHIYRTFSLCAASLITALLIGLAPWLIQLFFGAEFAESVLILRITAFAVLFVAMNEVYGTNYLIVRGHDRVMRNITLVSSLIGFALAFPLIHYFQHIGAALVYTTSSFLLGVLSLLYAYKYGLKKDGH